MPQIHRRESKVQRRVADERIQPGKPISRGGKAANGAEAEALCLELGLATQIDRVRTDLQQRVSEPGWQRSQGEPSRVFIARALLQNARLTGMDDGFVPLDRETL